MKKCTDLIHLRQLCGLGLPGPTVVPALLRGLRHVVAFDWGAFFWVDAQGDIVNMYSERMLPSAVTYRYFERHYDAEAHSFRGQLAARLARGELVGQVCADGALERTAYYREVLQPLDVHRILYSLVLQGARVIGQLSLYRARRHKPFEPADRESLMAASRYLAQALSVGTGEEVSGADAWRDSEQQALLVCDGNGTVVEASPVAPALLAQASGEAINRSTICGPLERAGQGLLRAVTSPLSSYGGIGRDGYSERLVANAWGRYRLRAYPMAGDRFAVHLQRQEHLLVRITEAMRAHALSPQQRETALLLARGRSNPQIAETMGVSLNTAGYHVKQLFQRLDAHDRSAVIARLLDGHTQRG